MCVTKFGVCLSSLQYNDKPSHQSYALSCIYLSNMQQGSMDNDTITIPKFQNNQSSMARHWAHGLEMVLALAENIAKKNRNRFPSLVLLTTMVYNH